VSWNPPGGAVGDGVAALLRRGPRRALDADLVRFTSLLEAGRTTARGQRVTRADLTG